MDKTKKRILLEKILRLMARAILKKYKPRVVAITGSIGKTSTKEAVYKILSDYFYVRKSEKNYNNEVGIPLTIIGSESGGRSFLKWLWVVIRFLVFLLFPLKYPKILILEMGADRPGDIEYLIDFIHPEVGIITDISGSHLEFFNSLAGVAKEKGILVKKLSENSLAILNADNELVYGMKSQIKAKVSTFGFSDEADFRASDSRFNYDGNGNISGLSFKLTFKGTTLPVRLNYVLARHQIFAILSAIACADKFGINLVEATQALADFTSPPGRMNLIPGIKESEIIDDTYNASPKSVIAALDTLGDIKSGRKIAVLGDILELGRDTEEGHKQVAQKFLEIKGNIFMAVGTRMQFAVSELMRNNFDESYIFSFENSLEAGRKLQEIIQKDDLILVKGSQGARMEKIVEEIMRYPQEAEKRLCRQSIDWKACPVKNI